MTDDFSAYMMKTLGRLPPTQSIAALQAIMTIAFNVSQNTSLDTVDTASAYGFNLWDSYLVS